MKKIMFFIVLIALVACNEETSQKNIVIKNPSTEEITKETDCENCGMNIEHFILSSHAIHTTEGKNHYYCSINCCTAAWNKEDYNSANVFAIVVDKKPMEYVSVEKLRYVIGSTMPPVMSSVSKYAFKDSTSAEQFKMEQQGDTIIGYKEVFKMCEEELAKR